MPLLVYSSFGMDMSLKQKALEGEDGIQESHKNLPYVLQQVESTICLDIICKKIFEIEFLNS